jgi:cysteinyl-tRNA synthetase
VHALSGAFGLVLDRGAIETDAEIDALVAARQAARAARNFAEADRLRDEIAALGIVIEDTPAGPTWRRA